MPHGREDQKQDAKGSAGSMQLITVRPQRERLYDEKFISIFVNAIVDNVQSKAGKLDVTITNYFIRAYLDPILVRMRSITFDKRGDTFDENYSMACFTF